MTTAPPPADWYPDPAGSGWLRFWDGTAWTGHCAAPPPVHGYPAAPYGLPPQGPWGKPPWKGAELGRPATGSGALAEPGRRLGARMLDLLLFVPVFGVLLTVTLLIAAPHFGPLFPDLSTSGGNYGGPGPSAAQPVPTPGFVWAYLTVFGTLLVTSLLLLVYETVAVARFGHTLGMKWLRLRPLRVAGGPLGWGRAFVRALIFWVAGVVGWLGALDPLWCLWDDQRQCLHDKAADSIVVND